MKTYDTNSDGKLDAAEQEKVPALKKHLADYDGDKDGNLTAAEITNRIASWHKQSEIGLLSLQCVVTLDGRPLKDAKVEFLPEAFLGTAIQPASGTTNEAGMAPLAMPADKLPPQVPKGAAFVHVGIYKVSVTHPTAKIPPKYTGASTVLGHEIVQGVRDYEGAKFELSSK